MSVSIRLGNVRRYCVTKGSIFCASDISLSENLISQKVFFYNSSSVISILQACFEIAHVFLKSKLRVICSQKP